MGEETANSIKMLLELGILTEHGAAVLWDYTADETPGKTIRVSRAFTEIGKQLTSDAKSMVSVQMGSGEMLDADNGIIFTRRPSYTQRRINTARIKQEFPFSENPDLYNLIQMPESIAVKMVKKG